MRLAIVGGAYQEPYKRANAQRCVNWYPHMISQAEIGDEDDKRGYLKPTPGLTEVVNVAGTRVRGLYSDNDLCFFVVGNILYQLDNNSATTIGTMTNLNADDGQRIYMYLNGNNQLGIFGGVNGYVYDVDAATLTEITDVDFLGADHMEYMDGYGLVTRNGRVYFCELNDFTNWIGDSVFTPTYEADKTLAVMKLRGTIWTFGRRTIEPYYNDGTTPFTRTPQASIDLGVVTANSMAKFEEGIIFLGRSSRGSIGIYLLDKQHGVAILSPGSINEQLSADREALDSAYSFIEQSTDSHIFYHISIPDLGRTFTYDILTKEWHERSSIAPFPDAVGNDIHGVWRAHNMTEYRGDYLVGDYYSGSIFKLDATELTENGTRIERERVFGPNAEEQKRVVVRDFILDLDSNKSAVTSPKLMFSFSSDGGSNYRQEREYSLPTPGIHGERLRIKNLGYGYNWTVKMRLTDETDLAIIGASFRGTSGAR